MTALHAYERSLLAAYLTALRAFARSKGDELGVEFNRRRLAWSGADRGLTESLWLAGPIVTRRHVAAVGPDGRLIVAPDPLRRPKAWTPTVPSMRVSRRQSA